MPSNVIPIDDVVFFRQNDFLARENEPPVGLFRVIEGWACRYRLLSDGRRQITGIYLPGDFCDPHWALGRMPTQPVIALTNLSASCGPCRVPPGTSGEMQESFWTDLIERSERQASWMVTLGRRSALEKLAHLLLALFERMRRSGLTYGQQCAFPLTQMDIADATGLTPVHVNRTLQAMRREGLITLRSQWLSIPNVDMLRQAAAISPQDEAA